MANVTMTQAASIAGVTISGSVVRTASGLIGQDLSLAVAKVGQLTTRTNDTQGVITLVALHGITTGKVDIYWTGGMRYGVDATVVVNACTITGGAGDNLPSNLTAVTVCVPTTVDIDFSGDLLEILAAVATKRSHVDFLASGGSSLLAIELTAGAPWFWCSDLGVTNPLAGDTVASATVSNGDSTGASALKIGALYDSDS
jgi:hypothetical protein